MTRNCYTRMLIYLIFYIFLARPFSFYRISFIYVLYYVWIMYVCANFAMFLAVDDIWATFNLIRQSMVIHRRATIIHNNYLKRVISVCVDVQIRYESRGWGKSTGLWTLSGKIRLKFAIDHDCPSVHCRSFEIGVVTIYYFFVFYSIAAIVILYGQFRYMLFLRRVHLGKHFYKLLLGLLSNSQFLAELSFNASRQLGNDATVYYFIMWHASIIWG